MNKQEKIESVKQGRFVWLNDGTLEQLREVLRMTLPSITFHAFGEHKYYHLGSIHDNYWSYGDTTNFPNHSVKDFFNSDESEIKEEGSLRIAAQKLLDAVSKHHPQMAMDIQLDLYMAFHEVREAIKQ